MQRLEQLYDLAEAHLMSDPVDWESFGEGLGRICDAEMVLYQTFYDTKTGQVAQADCLATTAPAVIDEYQNSGLQKTQPVPENSLTPLEPSRRSDFLSDEELLAMPIYGDFVRKHDFFYQLIVPTFLPDHSVFALMLWRGANMQEFDDLEKQRLALFMRHLTTSFNLEAFGTAQKTREIQIFGDKYDLTPSETEILTALLQGKSLRSISVDTERSYGTIRWHVQNILDKSQVSSQKSLLSEFYSLL